MSEFLNRIFLETNSKKWKIFILFTLHSYSRTFHLRITIYEALCVPQISRSNKKFENFPKESTFHGINPRMEAGKGEAGMYYIFSEDKIGSIAWKNSILHFLIYSRITFLSNHISLLHEYAYIYIYLYHIIRENSKKFPTRSNLICGQKNYICIYTCILL